ncbi:MAG: insulinase family protein [Bacteroidales bacterium]|jgi:predicted Zn-dependent peptidase|nr:insulinase family protein [Bacteroidales bacterium]
MIRFVRHQLSNGLQILVYPDNSTPMAALDVCYHVGSRDEEPHRTGFAHLFEHLMFGGSKNIPDFDLPLQQAGGENNAYTTNDMTNYYMSLPATNIELGFWLESDRMLELDFSEENLALQRNVVIEEFKQRTLNQPYGDVWFLLREMAYQVHPYRWPTIGKDISHIALATLDEVKAFFFRYYAPDNAAVVVSGHVKPDECFRLAEKWFGPVPRRNVIKQPLPEEPEQTAFREQTVRRRVPDNALYFAFHMDARHTRGYYVCDMITDVLACGNSSRLYQKMVMEKRLFVEIDSYISGDSDPGLLVVSGKLARHVRIETARKAVWNELNRLKAELIPVTEIEKVKNKLETEYILSQLNYLNMAQELAALENVGGAELINRLMSVYLSVTPEEIMLTAARIFRPENCSQLNYLTK